MFIRINFDHKKNKTIIKKRKTINISIIKNVFSKRKSYIEKIYVNV